MTNEKYLPAAHAAVDTMKIASHCTHLTAQHIHCMNVFVYITVSCYRCYCCTCGEGRQQRHLLTAAWAKK